MLKQSKPATPDEPVSEEASPLPDSVPPCPHHGYTDCTYRRRLANGTQAPTAGTVAALMSERDKLRGQLAKLLREAQSVAALKYEITHKGSGPPSDYDPDIYQLEKVTASGWWRFVHTVRDLLGAKEKPAPQPEKGSPTCLDCGHPLTDADRQAPVCPYCGCP